MDEGMSKRASYCDTIESCSCPLPFDKFELDAMPVGTLRDAATDFRVWAYTRDNIPKSVRARKSYKEFLEKFPAAVAVPLRGTCPVCGGVFRITRMGVMHHHNGDVYQGGWRQVCAGVGQVPATVIEAREGAR